MKKKEKLKKVHTKESNDRFAIASYESVFIGGIGNPSNPPLQDNHQGYTHIGDEYRWDTFYDYSSWWTNTNPPRHLWPIGDVSIGKVDISD